MKCSVVRGLLEIACCKHFSHSSKVFKAHVVFLLVFFGVSPLLSMKNSSSLTNSEKQGGPVREAGLGSATELEVELSPRAEFCAQSVHSHMPRQKGEKEQAMAAVSRIYYRYQGNPIFTSLNGLHVLVMIFDEPIRCDI